MIYLFDEKFKFQPDLSEEYYQSKINDRVVKIITNEPSKELVSELQKNCTTLLLHDSFISNVVSNGEIKKDLSKSIDRLLEKKVDIIKFSGTINEKVKPNKNLYGIPRGLFYKNLKEFLDEPQENRSVNILLHGSNIREIDLKKRYIRAIKAYKFSDYLTEDRDGLLLQSQIVESPGEFVQFTRERNIEKKFLTLPPQVLSRLNQREYTVIYIPISYGDYFSNFSGLRLATHIRCTKGKNQYATLFVYSYVAIEELFDHEFFNILRCKGVHFIDLSNSGFEKAAKTPITSPSEVQDYLAEDISKLNLSVPSNYEDSHSVANEWAIYRWAIALNKNELLESIESVYDTVKTNIYFKYLTTKHNSEESKSTRVKIKPVQENKNSKILLVDDQASRGWEVLIKHIALNMGLSNFDSLEVKKSGTTDQLVESIVAKVTSDNIDVVILDLRLHPADATADIEKITGYRILQRIKEFNPGIQVIVFSATNKTWNLRKLQAAGVNGFIRKESLEDAQVENITSDTINGFVRQLELCVRKAQPLKEVHRLSGDILKLNRMHEHITNDSQLEIMLETAKVLFEESFDRQNYLSHCYIQLYLIIEMFARAVIDETKYEAYLSIYNPKTSNNVKFVSKYTDGKNYRSAIKHVKGINCPMTKKDNLNDYHLEVNPKSNVRYRIASILLIRFDKKETDDIPDKNAEYSAPWKKINSLRNELAHFNFSKNSKISSENVLSILVFLQFLFDNSNCKRERMETL